MAKKTISGARAKKGQRSNGCNPKHNNRDYLPSNADPNRQHLNIFFCESTKSVTIEQIYDKLFQASYEEWLEKEHAKGRQKDAPEKYLDKIRTSGDKKRDQYEIIWQLGDMKNTGWNSNQDDFMKARQLLADFAEYLLSQPNIAVVTPERMADPNWQPPFDDGLIVTNLALHGDENTPQMHMDFIPYSRSKSRGQSIQNAYAAAFEGMGYKVEEVHLVDESTGELQYKKDKNGKIVRDKKGEPVPVMVKTSFGSIDWIEEQKGWLQREMELRHGWEREYKGKNPFGDVTMSEYVAEDNLRQAAAAAQDAIFQHQLADAEAQRAEKARQRVQDASDKAEDLEGKNNALKAALDAQQQRYARNNAVIQDQEEALGLIQSVEQYQDEALDLIDEIDTAKAMVVNEMPKATKFFKLSGANSFIQTMAKLLDGLRKHINDGIQRLRIFEKTHVVDDPLSEPVQKHADDVGALIDNAFARYHEENGSKGNRSHLKNEGKEK